jgi:hypothetical protein
MLHEKTVSTLPEGDREILSANLKQNRKQLLWVNGLRLRLDVTDTAADGGQRE